MGEIVISFCIPVYNQIEIVRETIGQILKARGDEIEVVVNDDCSTDDMEAMVRELGDGRVKYYRNSVNLGHDCNIINSFRRAGGKYAFLLRSRDQVIPEAIPKMVQYLKENQDTAYMTGEALDENGKTRIRYDKRSFPGGTEAVKAHMNLYIHPSGSLYSLEKLDLDRVESFLKENIETKYSFIAHNLFRMYLAEQGSFELLDYPVWIYTNTLKAADVAVNSTRDRSSVYAPELLRQRYRCEMMWAAQVLEEAHKLPVYEFLFKHYLDQATWFFKSRNLNRQMQRHYNYAPVEASMGRERRLVLQLTDELKNMLIRDRTQLHQFEAYQRKAVLKNRTWGLMRYYMGCFIKKIRLKWLYDVWRIGYADKKKL